MYVTNKKGAALIEFTAKEVKVLNVIIDIYQGTIAEEVGEDEGGNNHFIDRLELELIKEGLRK